MCVPVGLCPSFEAGSLVTVDAGRLIQGVRDPGGRSELLGPQDREAVHSCPRHGAGVTSSALLPACVLSLGKTRMILITCRVKHIEQTRLS